MARLQMALASPKQQGLACISSRHCAALGSTHSALTTPRRSPTRSTTVSTRVSAWRVVKVSASDEEPFWMLTQVNEMGDDLDFALQLGSAYSVGRTEDNNCTIPYGTISGAHAMVETTADGDLYITDLGSTNGTKVSVISGRKEAFKTLEANSKSKLDNGVAVVFGDPDLATFRVFYIDPAVMEAEDGAAGGGEEEEEEEVELRGPTFEADKITPKSTIIGEGNYGEVFQGELRGGGGLFRGKATEVILKRAKPRVGGAEEMLQLEVEMNCRVSQRAPGVTAAYMGYCIADRGGQIYNNELTDGLWLVWEFETRNTLDSYLQLGSYPKGLLSALGQDAAGGSLTAARSVMTQLLKLLDQLHSAKLVHRDIKPSNILVLEGKKQDALRLIDLGACADLNDGFNFTVGACPRDPRYCPPECDLGPPTAEGESEKVAVENLGEFWAQYQPSSFDVYSAGVVLMQLAVPMLREEASLVAFNQQLAEAGYELSDWKAGAGKGLAAEVLDANEGAGWDLAARMLGKPTFEYRESSGKKVPGGDVARPTAEEALKHPFFTK